jgi:hypothetical protein
VEKVGRAGQATDNNTAHAHCRLNTKGYKHTIRISNIYCFSTAKIIARARLSVTLYVNCMSCNFYSGLYAQFAVGFERYSVRITSCKVAQPDTQFRAGFFTLFAEK